MGTQATLLVLPTGTGKTIVFARVIENAVRAGGRCLVLAHRAELLNQAADKLHAVTGLGCAVEKAETTAVDTWYNVVVGSVQTMQRENRRSGHEFTHIIVDEAHHAVSPSYRAVIDAFPGAKILGVTATADRGDKRDLGEVFETLAYEYTLPAAIRDGFLCPIRALTIPLKIDLSSCQANGDFVPTAVGNALDPYLAQIADHLVEQCADRKTVVFLPLIATSMKFLEMLRARGVDAREVNGESTDRAEVLKWIDNAGPGAVLCNAMLLTEGWDCPSVDCICVLRPTKIRSLYAQMVGRGTRILDGKADLLLLDFLWHSERHELCRPAHLVCEDPDISRRVAELLAEAAAGESVDLLYGAEDATGTATEEREEALRKVLEEQKHKRRKLVDPLQYECSIDAREYTPDPADLKELAPPSMAQLAWLEKAGIFPDEISSKGHAAQLIDTVKTRRMNGLATPKQIRCLERYGFQAVGSWQFDSAKRLIDRIAGNMWHVPRDIRPATYQPKETVLE